MSPYITNVRFDLIISSSPSSNKKKYQQLLSAVVGRLSVCFSPHIEAQKHEMG